MKRKWFLAAGILMVGMIAGGFLLWRHLFPPPIVRGNLSPREANQVAWLVRREIFRRTFHKSARRMFRELPAALSALVTARIREIDMLADDTAIVTAASPSGNRVYVINKDTVPRQWGVAAEASTPPGKVAYWTNTFLNLPGTKSGTPKLPPSDADKWAAEAVRGATSNSGSLYQSPAFSQTKFAASLSNRSSLFMSGSGTTR